MLPIDEKSAVELPLGGIRIHATIRLLHRFGSWWLKESETYADIGGYVEWQVRREGERRHEETAAHL